MKNNTVCIWAFVRSHFHHPPVFSRHFSFLNTLSKRSLPDWQAKVCNFLDMDKNALFIPRHTYGCKLRKGATDRVIYNSFDMHLLNTAYITYADKKRTTTGELSEFCFCLWGCYSTFWPAGQSWTPELPIANVSYFLLPVTHNQDGASLPCEESIWNEYAITYKRRSCHALYEYKWKHWDSGLQIQHRSVIVRE